MRVVMMGTGTFAEPTFEALVAAFGDGVVGLVTQPDREVGRRTGASRQTGKGMTALAQFHGVPVTQPESVNDPGGLVQLEQLAPDLLVVAAYGQILSKDVLRVPTRGTINVHASLLPKYRGAAPVAYAILNGETVTGVTIIKVTPGLDSGDMVAQEPMEILPDDTTGSLELRLADVGAKLAVEVAWKYAAGGPVDGVKQDPTQVTKAPKIKKEFGLIDWTQPAERIVNHVRAMQPWPTAYTFFHRPGKEPMRVIVTKAGCVPWPEFVEHAQPGHAFSYHSGGRFGGIAGDGGAVEIHELQPAGKKRMTAQEFDRGYPVDLFDRFGPEGAS